MDSKVRVVTFISEERGDPSSSTRGIIIREFRKRKQRIPVVLLVIAKYPEVLLESLIGPFRLSVTFRMVPGGEVELFRESGKSGKRIRGLGQR